MRTVVFGHLDKAQEKSVEVSFENPELLMVMADEEKLIQVLVNLLGNAVKFTPSGGKVKVAINQTDGHVQLDVVDTGVGMDQEDLDKLFGKFVRVKSGEGVEGSGLGLYLSKKLIGLMGGMMWARSAGVGKGSTFSFTLRVT